MEDNIPQNSNNNYKWQPLAVVGSFVLNFFYAYFVFMLASSNSLSGTFFVVPYFFIAFIWIYIFLSRFDKSIRKAAHISLLLPWAFLALILIPQFNDEPWSVTLFIIAFSVLILMKYPGEFVAKNIRNHKSNKS
ncbi:MAG: hypothetical protein HUJ16_05880 [Kangiella sp.]|nr:hypothetical protein [Kangiella sp.]